MRFLSIVWYKVLPAYFGGQKGIALFNHYLSVDAPLDCLCSKNNESSINLPYNTIPALPNSKTQFLNPFCWKTIIATARKQKSTHLILEHPYYGIAGFLAKKILKIKLIVHSHNIEYLRFKELKKWWWPFLQWYEGWTYQQADLNIFKTTSDCNRAIHQFRLQQNKCVIIPYGTGGSFPFDEKTQARKEMEKLHGINADEKILLFAGTLDYLPNAEAVKAIYTIIAPELVKKGLLFKIFICGRNRFQQFQYLKQFSHPNIIQIGEVAAIEPYFAAADVFINPVISNTGMQTKIIDALSFHCNVVCFEPILSCIPVELIAEKIFSAPVNDWMAFIDQIEKGFKNAASTPVIFFEELNWNKLIKKLIDKLTISII